MYTPLIPHTYPTWIKLGAGMCSIFFILSLCDFPHYFHFHQEIRKAKTAFEAGDYECARLHYTQLSSQFPDNKEVKLQLTHALFKSKQPEAHKLALETLANLSLTTAEYNELLKYMPQHYAMYFQTTKKDNA